MTREEIMKVFDYLENNLNPYNTLYFKLIDIRYIEAYWKESDGLFATFYVDKILEVINDEE